jgi:hypothetical protein
LLDIGGGEDDNDDVAYSDGDNSYDHNHHPSAFELSSSSSLSSVFQVKFYSGQQMLAFGLNQAVY